MINGKNVFPHSFPCEKLILDVDKSPYQGYMYEWEEECSKSTFEEDLTKNTNF